MREELDCITGEIDEKCIDILHSYSNTVLFNDRNI